ncbi:SIR2-like domain-containing protein [Polaromonas sp. YR568]|uniref:SIR2 family NAD-dependent protein deacylase n=1 Tax=Polaromonas sp. YR568 TaxID=1855301 RepID=UPI0008E8F6D0|nr:SIR2 family protein [Polaromonas sp. YR568]SFU70056.1 SIR2-like domain-containing protein [Polaromonas sp. YR568]
METFHNPDRFMGDLRQILSQGRKRIGLLVGAGAPLSIKVDSAGNLDDFSGAPLIPGVEELTRVALSNLDPIQTTAASSVRDLLGDKANIETILSHIRLLSQALGQAEINGLNGHGYSELSKAICKAIGLVVGPNLPKQRNAYSELISWISGTLRTNAVEIFTTNYDLLFEEALERARAPYFDGFSGGASPFFDPVTVAGDDLPSRWSRLWKLHGSIGWALEDGNVVRGRGRDATQLVYPDHLKYDLTQKQPYAALFERLKRFVLTPDTLLLATGFSFRDAHVCAILDEALAMNSNTAVFAFQYQSLEAENAACRLAYDHPNLSVYASDGAVINGIPGKWRPGELPKNWQDIRATFWGTRRAGDPSVFLLGDFSHFTRFCALAQATDLSNVTQAVKSEELVDVQKGDIDAG